MANTGTRLRLASNKPLIKCRLPGPQLPAHTASCPVTAASAAAANPAASSCRTCSQVISPSRRSASMNPFTESPGIPYTRRTPDAFSAVTMTSATVLAMICSFRGCGYSAAQNAQWCLAAKSVSTCGRGGTSDSICMLSALNAGQGTSGVDGLPLAAKLAQAARMLAASASWPGLNGSWNGASGRSNRYVHSDLWVATRGPVTGGS